MATCMEQQNWQPFLRGYREERALPAADIQATPYFVAIRQLWRWGLHGANAGDWGSAWMNDQYIDRTLKFLREWQAEYLG
jgi:Ser/Thr protein kinase RdoA (MazF antagonist)